MRWRPVVLAVLSAPLLGVPPIAMATAAPETDAVNEPRHFLDRPLSLNVALGTGTVVGGPGGIVEYSIWQRFAVGGGLGVSWVGDEKVLGGGLQGGAFGRFRVQTWEGERASQALTMVGGFSTGHFHYPILAGDGPSVSEQAYWVQLAFDYELLTRGGFRLTTGVGAAILAATSGIEESYTSLGGNTEGLPRLFLSVDLTIGYAL